MQSGCRLHADETTTRPVRREASQLKPFQLPLAAGLSPAAGRRPLSAGEVLNLQRTVGNAAVAQMLSVQRASVIRPVGYGNEKLKMKGSLSAKKKSKRVARAKKLMEEIEATYGIKVDSSAGVSSVKESYSAASGTEKAKVKAKPWTMTELRALRQTLKSYAPILGQSRKSSSRSGLAQELRSVSKVNTSMDKNAAGQTVVDPDTLGETFAEDKNVSIFSSLSKADLGPFLNRQTRIAKTQAHEMAHALIQPYALGDFVQTFSPYWVNATTRRSGASRDASGLDPVPEAPISSYGGTSAKEDLCETAGYFLAQPGILDAGNTDENAAGTAGAPGNRAPLRKAWMENVVEGWKKKPNVVKRFFRSVKSA